MAIRKICPLGAALAALTLLSIWGCTPPITIESTPGPGHEIGLQRVFIVLDSAEIDQKSRLIRMPGAEFGNTETDTLIFSAQFLEELEGALDETGVQSRTYAPAGPETDRDEVMRQAEEFEAQAILWIFDTLTGFELVDLGTRPSFTKLQETFGLDARLLTIPITNQHLWQGTIKTSLAPESWRAFAPGMADALVDRLVTDGVIGTVPADAGGVDGSR